jgi:hypothetical protein
MVWSYASRVLCWGTLMSLAVALAMVTQPVLGAKRAGRPSYAQTATLEQREKMDKIYDEYKPKIAALQSQIKLLRDQVKGIQKERNDKMAAVLAPAAVTPEEKKPVASDTAKKAKEPPAKRAKQTPPPAAGGTPPTAGTPPAGDTPAK